MNKIRVIQFSPECGARIFINPDNLDELALREDVLVNPDLREVKGVPTCFWKKVGYQVYKMTEEEMEAVRMNFAVQGSPFVQDDISKMRRHFLSKNAFKATLFREREDFQRLLIGESERIVNKLRVNIHDATHGIEEKVHYLNAHVYNTEQTLMKMEKKIKLLLIITSLSLIAGVICGILR